jgi:hypothetical protein
MTDASSYASSEGLWIRDDRLAIKLSSGHRHHGSLAAATQPLSVANGRSYLTQPKTDSLALHPFHLLGFSPEPDAFASSATAATGRILIRAWLGHAIHRGVGPHSENHGLALAEDGLRYPASLRLGQ